MIVMVSYYLNFCYFTFDRQFFLLLFRHFWFWWKYDLYLIHRNEFETCLLRVFLCLSTPKSYSCPSPFNGLVERGLLLSSHPTFNVCRFVLDCLCYSFALNCLCYSFFIFICIILVNYCRALTCATIAPAPGRLSRRHLLASPLPLPHQHLTTCSMLSR